MPEHLKLDKGDWYCGLFECCIENDTKIQKTYYICCDVLAFQYVAGVGLPLLRVHSPSSVTILRAVNPGYMTLSNEFVAVGGINQCSMCHTVYPTYVTPAPTHDNISYLNTDPPVIPRPPVEPKVVLKVSDIKYPNVMYLPVRVHEFETITIFLKERDTHTTVKSANLISCVLHFKKQK